jgi:hypothetical protein
MIVLANLDRFTGHHDVWLQLQQSFKMKWFYCYYDGKQSLERFFEDGLDYAHAQARHRGD